MRWRVVFGNLFLCILLLTLCIGLYIGYNDPKEFYATHFFPNSKLGSYDIGNKTVEEVLSIYENLSAGNVFTVSTRDDTYEINLDDVNFVVEYDGDIQSFLDAQNVTKWWEGLLQSYEYDDVRVYSYNKDLLKMAFTDLPCISGPSVVAPRDARIAMTEDGYFMVPEVTGNTLDVESAFYLVDYNLSKGLFTADISDSYIYPEVYSDDEFLNYVLDQMDAVQSLQISVDMVGATEIIPKDVLLRCISWDGESRDIVVDTAPVSEWMGFLGGKYNTWLQPHMFTTHSGEVIDVHQQLDTYGFCLDEAATEELVTSAVKERKNGTVTAVWQGVAPTVRNGKNGDIDDTYIEVSLSEQHMWVFKDGVCIIDTPVVTGTNSDPSRRTPPGVYYVCNKFREVTMSGSYGTAFCHFWLGVTQSGVGIHDAPWRGEFGGSIYEYSGSHGCINTPYDAEEFIYNNIEEMTPVVIY